MPRILGVDLPNDKPTHISLRYIYGIGPTTSLELCHKAGVDPQRRARDLSDEELARLAARTDKVQRDMAAGALNNQQITYILIALGTAVLVLILVKA